MKLSLRLSAVILIALSFFQVSAQQVPDSSLNESISGVRQFYFSQIGNNAQIYHGDEYIRSGIKAAGFPYYKADSMLPGTITYRGVLYPGKLFYYDMVADQLIIYNYTQDALITLSSEKLDSFSIGNHSFIKIHAEKSNGLSSNGFYERLFPGDPALCARREKILNTGTGSEDIKYVQKNNYYIKINNVYFLVDSKDGLLGLLSDQRDALTKFIRSNRLDFKKDLENALLLSTAYYYKLKN